MVSIAGQVVTSFLAYEDVSNGFVASLLGFFFNFIILYTTKTKWVHRKAISINETETLVAFFFALALCLLVLVLGRVEFGI